MSIRLNPLEAPSTESYIIIGLFMLKWHVFLATTMSSSAFPLRQQGENISIP